MLQFDPQLSAKVFKRVAQLRRLGPRGIIHTAYVRTLGPAVYALTDPARNVAAGLHRQRALGRALPLRLNRLKERASSEINGGQRAGIRINPDRGLGSFVQTLEAMLDLAAAGCAVSRAIAVDWDANCITCEYVEESGDALNEEMRTRLEDALLAIHRAGYVLGAINADDIVFSTDGNPVVVNLQHSIPLAGLSRDMSVFLRDADRRAFNHMFGTRLLTADRLRDLLSPNASIARDKARGFTEVYAPVVLRDDIRWGKIWNTDLGTGRWNFIMKEHLPIPQGGTVLDLGSNNGFNPLQMLRAGAASAVGVEIEPQAIEQSKIPEICVRVARQSRL